VRIRNPSALPQAFGCTNLPAGIGVFPNHGFGYILPGGCVCACVPNHGFGYILPGGCVCVCVCVRERERERERERAHVRIRMCVCSSTTCQVRAVTSITVGGWCVCMHTNVCAQTSTTCQVHAVTSRTVCACCRTPPARSFLCSSLSTVDQEWFL